MIVQNFNFIPDTLSDKIIELAEKNGVWQQSGLLNPMDGTIARTNRQRTDSEIWLERTKGLTDIRNVIEPSLRKIVQEHPLWLEHKKKFSFYEMRVLRYECDQFLTMHRDNDKIIHYSENNFYGSREEFTGDCTHRWLTICIYLSSHSGGELKFKDGTIYKTEKNSLMLFPGSTEEYMHESLPVSAGTKYVITSWVCS
jgi:hypothetical protein